MIKYLSGFRWHHLTEKMGEENVHAPRRATSRRATSRRATSRRRPPLPTAAYEARVRTAKLRAELSSAKKEAEHYLRQVDLARQLQKKEKAGGGGDGAPGATSAPRRQFKQRRVLDGTS